MNGSASRRTIETATIGAPDGLRVTLVNLGASIQRIQVPLRQGLVDAVLGYKNHEDYRYDEAFMGSTLGPFANRIRGARFELDNRTYNLDKNDRPAGNCLHGGSRGFHRRFWDMHEQANALSLRLDCRVLEEETGFPGNQEITVIYQIINKLCLQMDYWGQSDKATVLSMANHAYFNLDRRHGNIDSHCLCIDSDLFTPTDDSAIPTGEIRTVTASDVDLRRPGAISERRFDDTFVLRNGDGGLRKAAELHSPDSGLRLRVYTTQPALQLYTGDKLDSPFRPRQGVCLEAQAFPDAPNQPGFPSARLSAGETYHQRTVYEFLP
ncbi:MAG: aldose epimerase family protein [Pseudomonadota bacterium]